MMFLKVQRKSFFLEEEEEEKKVFGTRKMAPKVKAFAKGVW